MSTEAALALAVGTCFGLCLAIVALLADRLFAWMQERRTRGALNRYVGGGR